MSQVTLRKLEDYPITLFRRGDGKSDKIYYYFTDHKGKAHKGSCKTSDEKQAARFVTKVYNDIISGKRIAKPLDFTTCVKKFLDFKKDRVKAKTYAMYKHHSTYLIERYKTKDVNDFIQKDVNDYIKWRRGYYKTHKTKQVQQYKRNGKVITGRKFTEVSNCLLNREAQLLVAILRYAQVHEHQLVDKPCPKVAYLEENIRSEPMSDSERDQILAYFDEENLYYAQMIRFLLLTGLRYPQELNNLIWSDVDWNKQTILIRAMKSKKKTPQHRNVPLVDRAVKILEALHQRDKIKKRQNDYIFVDDNGNRILNIRKSFKACLKVCKIKNDYTLYHCRHKFAQDMAKRPDIPLPFIARAMGHVDTKMIELRYGHFRDHDAVKAFNASEKKREEIILQRKMEANVEEIDREINELRIKLNVLELLKETK
ncbi:tyrosine-type recombinase/integrase [Desulfocurvibacter africanus]|uniref:tyrosine-type recombinase/integrase n=1 Tax=Desulfocurvibacter africanus TaxID=873 RepID=UPI000425BD7D|nr:site-specific integrase [Desulfocurvibacter africanus]